MERITRRSFVSAATVAVAAVGTAATVARAEEAPTAETEGSSVKPSNAPAWLGSEPEISDIVETKSCDVLIVGAGNAGMVAAATASELGLDYLVAEKLTVVSGYKSFVGAVNTSHTYEAGVEVDVDRIKLELARYASFKCDPRVQNVWIDESAAMMDWLDGVYADTDEVCTVPTENGPEGDVANETGFYIPPIEHDFAPEGELFGNDRNVMLQERIEAADGPDRILWSYDLARLMHEDGKVTGAIFETDDGYVQIDAHKAVVLATGGYPANTEMLAALAPDAVACITSSACHPQNTGMGIKTALWAGAKMDDVAAPMVFNRGAVAPGVDAGLDENGSFATTGMWWPGSQPFMKVNRDGRRFCNESSPYDFVCFAAGHQKGGVWAMVCDANAPTDVNRFLTVGCSRTHYDEGTTVDDAYGDAVENGSAVRAETIEELADKLGFTGEAKENFLDEVERYNGFYDQQHDDDFGKEAYRLSELRTPPFYGCWLGGALLTTCDGLRINENMQVLDTEGEVIEGLYAAGDCSGNFFAGNYPEYLVGVACGRTLTFARHAIQHIAGEK